MCMIDECDAPSVYLPQIRKARKEHKCCECFRQIEIGEQYEQVTGNWDGSWGSFKTCLHCLEARKWLMKQCHGYVHGAVFEDLREHISYARLHVGRLVVGMNRKWTKRNGDRMALPKAL
jgi:hypothetical protein